ncbi:NADPH-dependent curcumin reductase [Sterolibacterium denitrificans]|uniref:NADPH-dependent curcumin reductase n=1 Tax=Sterolibacterium denitrificans TaxID=157592 RepID=A0A7Z7MW16_9PROT|nr:NADP-dependent oxidoreductase [Sterolibacterium denitrificans]SMB27931.1 NADPH-dependent curcumin reductase [Sterolibacterium denitrificans]
MRRNRQVILVSRPPQQGWLSEENFRLVETPLPEPGEGELLVRNHWLSLDPYMRGRMNEARSYAPPQSLGEVMLGGTAGEVIVSQHPGFRPGDKVVGRLGWQEYALSDGSGLRRVDDAGIPLSASLGVLGMPGVTAWIGLFDICRTQPGETVVVTAAAGAVGSVVGQLAKLHGCRVVGIAGGAEKCRYVVETLGFDDCIDYRMGADEFWPALKAATPARIDCLFENVGGEVFDILLGRMNAFSRIALCGMISQYNSAPYPIRNLSSILVNRIRMQGFIVTELQERWPAALAELTRHFAAGRIKYRETVVDGLAQAPAALIGLLRGENFGKQLVRLI